MSYWIGVQDYLKNSKLAQTKEFVYTGFARIYKFFAQT